MGTPARVLIGLLFLAVLGCGTESRHCYRPAAGYVPDAATAIRIAEAVWTPIYGERQLRSERPFHAELRGNRWHVYGTLTAPRGFVPVGGTAEADIDRRSGKILRVIHEK